MTLDEIQPFVGLACTVQTRSATTRITVTYTGRLEVVDETMVRIVGLPTLGGLSLGDGQAHSTTIESIVAITPGLAGP